MDVLHIPHPCGKKEKKEKTIFSIGEEGPVVIITLRLWNLCPKGILP
jgi:hypothetical protein